MMFVGALAGGIFGSVGLGGFSNMLIAGSVGFDLYLTGREILEEGLKYKKSKAARKIDVHSEVSDAWKSRIVRNVENDIKSTTSQFSDSQKAKFDDDIDDMTYDKIYEMYKGTPAGENPLALAWGELIKDVAFGAGANGQRDPNIRQRNLDMGIDENIDDFIQKVENEFGGFNLRKDLDVALEKMKENLDYYAKHSIFMLKDEASFDALLGQEHHGVIYIAWRVKDQNGNVLAVPQPYVGQTRRTGLQRHQDERNKARGLRKSMENNDGKVYVGEDERFIKMMASYDESIISLDDAFELQIYDIAYSQLELNIKEAVWTDHFDSDNPEVGFNYYRDPPAWGYSREGGTYITKSDLVQGVFDGLSYRGFTDDPRFYGRKRSTIRNYIQKYIKDDQGNIVKGLIQGRIVLIKPYLLEAISAGMDEDGIANLLHANGIILVDQKYQKFADGLKYYLEKAFNGWDYKKCREEFYIKPEMERLLAEGYFIPGIGAEEILPSDFSDLLDRIRWKTVQKTRLGTPASDLGLIEKLMLNGIKGNELTKVLGLWRDGDNAGAKLKARDRLRSYFRHRWNIQNPTEAKVLTFLVTHYLLDESD